jgi:hypothetical protein
MGSGAVDVVSASGLREATQVIPSIALRKESPANPRGFR